MKRLFALFFLGVTWVPAQARANFYEESCQTIRLHGKIEVPAEFPAKQQVQLTLAYQLNFEHHPTYFKINLPLGAKEYTMNFVGYRPRSEGDFFVPVMFLYPRAVKFQYYIKSRNGAWISPTKTSTYLPAATKVEDNAECQPDLELESLALNKK